MRTHLVLERGHLLMQPKLSQRSTWLEARKRDIIWMATASEIRYCSLLIGLIEGFWAFVGLIDNDPRSLFAARLVQSGLGEEWFVVLASVGAMLTAGSIIPWRRGRHMGLALSSLLWFTMTGVFLDLLARSPVAASMPLFAVFSLALLYADSKKKPRENFHR